MQRQLFWSEASNVNVCNDNRVALLTLAMLFSPNEIQLAKAARNSGNSIVLIVSEVGNGK